MTPNITTDADGRITLSVSFVPSSDSFLEYEEQVAEAVNAIGRLATEKGLTKLDTKGETLIHANKRYSGRLEKKNTKRPLEK
jgi:hypothetical protein